MSQTIISFFSNKAGRKEDLVHVNGDKIISDDNKMVQTFNNLFKNCINSLNITENKLLLTETKNTLGSVDESIKMFEIHPSIRSIYKNVQVDKRFSFSEVNTFK